MIKRNKRNIGKIVKIEFPENTKLLSLGEALNHRIGKVVGFRGDIQYRIPGKQQAIPWVMVLIKNLNNDKYYTSFPVPGKYLKVIR